MSVRIGEYMDQLLGDIAAIETLNTEHLVTKQELVRTALDFVYRDNEKMRECFRRSRHHHARRKAAKVMKKKRKVKSANEKT